MKQYGESRMFRYLLAGVALAAAVVMMTGCASGGGTTRSDGGEGGGAAAGYPDWYLNPQSVYADDTFLTAIGTGDSRRDAEQQALSGLSQIFEARVSVDSRTSERYRELMSSSGTMTETEINLAETSSVQSNQTLLNVQFGEAAVDETGRVHVIAYIERLPTGRVYRDLISRNGQQVERFLSEADDSGDLIRRYAYLSAAGVVAGSNEGLLDQLNIIVPGMAQTVMLPYRYDEVLKRRSDVAAQMGVRVSIAGDDDGRVASILREALSEERLPMVEDDPVLDITGAITVGPIPSNADFQSVRWTLTLSMTGPDGRSLVSYDEENRASGISEEAARAFAFRDLEKAVGAEFVRSMRGYFDGVVLAD